MTSQIINQSSDIIEAFKDYCDMQPDRFSKRLDALLKATGCTLLLEYPEFGSYFNGSNGTKYKIRISCVELNKKTLLLPVKFKKTQLPENSACERFTRRYVPTGEKSGVKSNFNNEGWKDSHFFKTEDYDYFSWARMTKSIGGLLGERLVDFKPCHRCNGLGVIPGFAHIDNGMCFRCLGTKGEFKVVKQ